MYFWSRSCIVRPGTNLDQRGEVCFESCPLCRIDRSTYWSVVQRVNIVPRMAPVIIKWNENSTYPNIWKSQLPLLVSPSRTKTHYRDSRSHQQTPNPHAYGELFLYDESRVTPILVWGHSFLCYPLSSGLRHAIHNIKLLASLFRGFLFFFKLFIKYNSWFYEYNIRVNALTSMIWISPNLQDISISEFILLAMT